MALKVLVSDPDREWCESAEQFLVGGGYEVVVALNGKDVQLKVSSEKFYAVILDIDTIHHSGLEVLKFLRLNAPSVKVALTMESEKRIRDMGAEMEDLLRLGASDILIKPYKQDNLLKSIGGNLQFKLWKNVSKKKKRVSEEGTIRARDDEFTRIKITDFYSGNAAIFDLYLRLKENRYIKILHGGDFFDPDVVKRYKEEKKVDYLYFRTQDRMLYIHFVNNMMKKLLKSPKASTKAKVNAIKNLSEKYIEEIYTTGLQPQLVDEGKEVCENIHDIIEKEPNLYKFLKEMEEFDPTAYTHAFLVVFFSSMICRFLDWASQATVDKIALGGMLHDIGKLKLDKSVMLLTEDKMNDKQLKEYKKHPEVGVDMVSSFPMITQPVKQIIFQHHELVDGTGFPAEITGIKIYPLAQVVGLVDFWSNLMTNNRLKPMAALKVMLKDHNILQRYDQTYLKALIKCFVDPDMEL